MVVVDAVVVVVSISSSDCLGAVACVDFVINLVVIVANVVNGLNVVISSADSCC